jgi:transcriptional regulator with XRE-family HTH domain
MSQLQKALVSLMERKRVNAAELSRITDVDRATISRWVNGSQLRMSDESLERIARALTDNPVEQAELIAARMLDIRTGPGSDLIAVTIAKSAVKPRLSNDWTAELPVKIEKAFRTIAAHIDQQEVRDLLLAIEELLEPRRKSKLISDNPVLDPNAPPPLGAPPKRRRRLWKGERGVEPIEEN